MNIHLNFPEVARILQKFDPRIAAAPVSRFIRKAAFLIEGRAKVNASANVFTGVGMGSIQTIAEARSATIGTNMEHMLYLHEGTRPHFPPIAAITPWANQKGIEPYLVARGIAKHGTPAHPFLRDAFDESEGTIRGPLLAQLGNEIESAFGSGG